MTVSLVDLESQLRLALQDLQIPPSTLDGVDSDTAQSAKEWFTNTSAVLPNPTDADSGAASFRRCHSIQLLVDSVQSFVPFTVPIPSSVTIEELLWKFVACVITNGDSAQKTRMESVVVLGGVEMHYVTSFPTMFDIFAHLSASEMFFVEGDSLLMHALSECNVDWDLVQPLHVFALAQTLLKRLQDREGRFHVVFFQDHEWMWGKSPVKRYLRKALHMGLSNVKAAGDSGSKLIVATFPSWSSKEFKEYALRHDPEFVLITDGEHMAPVPASLHPYTIRTTTASANTSSGTSLASSVCIVDDVEVGKAAAQHFHCFLIFLMSLRIQVVYSSRLLIKDNAVIAFVAQPSSDRFVLSTRLAAKCVIVAPQLAASFTNAAATTTAAIALTPEQEDYIDGVSQKDVFASHREDIAISALYSMTQHASQNGPALTVEEVAISKAFVVATVLMDVLTAEQRAQPGGECAALPAFLRRIAPHFCEWLSFFGVAAGDSKEFDVFDGHLLFAVTSLLRKQSPAALLSPALMARANALWEVATLENNGFTADVLIPGIPATVQAPSASAAGFSCVNVNHPLVNTLQAVFPVRGFKSDVPLVNNTRSHRALAGWDVQEPFSVYNDVLNDGELKDGKGNEVFQSRRTKMNTDRAKQTKQTADSLNQESFLFANEVGFVVTDGAATAKQNKAHSGQKQHTQKTAAELIIEQNELRKAMASLSKVKDIVDLLVAKKSTMFNSPTATLQDRDTLVNSIEADLKSFSYPMVTHGDDLTTPEVQAAWRSFCVVDATYERSVVENLAKFNEIVAFVKTKYAAAASAAAASLYTQMPEEDAVSILGRKFCAVFKAHVTMQLRTCVIALRLQAWVSEKDAVRESTPKRDPNTDLAMELFLCTQLTLTCLEKSRICPQVADVDIIRSAIANLDFPKEYVEYIDSLILSWTPIGKLTLLSASLRPKFNLLNLSATKFQLTLMGHKLERPVNKPDDRLPFPPDQWQKEVLDIVDARGCAVVCAPTSAGKTFISYYCMKKVLRTSNTDVVVYVAPTRALLNQAVADTTARYSSKKYQGDAFEVVGVAGGTSFCHHHTTCQVLVTVPEVFETMLLSPKYAEWTKRVKYVIFDEIHTIESSGSGNVWERVLALVTAPFVALSATLDKTEQLAQWLQRVQDRIKHQHTIDRTLDKGASAYTITMIPKSIVNPTTGEVTASKIQRWNDIKKWVYLPPGGAFTKLHKNLNAEFPHKHIQPLMPLSCITIEALQMGKFPPDLSLVPSECHDLFDAMKAQFGTILAPNYSDVDIVQSLGQKLAKLNPEMYFKGLRYITQSKARDFEREIKAELQYWSRLASVSSLPTDFTYAPLAKAELAGFAADMRDAVQNVLGESRKKLHDAEDKLEEAAGHGAASYVSFDFIKTHMMNVLHELKTKKQGPTIVFSFDTEVCDALAESVVNALEEADAKYRLTDEFSNSERDKKAKAAAKKKKAGEKKTQVRKKIVKGEDGKVTETRQDAIDSDNDDDDAEYVTPDELPEYCFIDRSTMEAAKLKAMLDECDKLGAELLIRAFKRGIAIHHAGISGKLRQFSEQLFRLKHCNVIFATETLALGVHSPCRSVVLAGNHVLLNTTQFRQMMGRAGRRGLDFLGHLVFLGIPAKKIDRLMTSDLMVIRGHQSMDPITQLRLLQLHKSSLKHAEHAAERLHVDPLFFLGRTASSVFPLSEFQVAHLQQMTHFFALHGLFSDAVDSSMGALASIVLHAYSEVGGSTSAIMFVLLLAKGVFHRSSPEETSAIMAYLFTKHRYFDIPLEIHRSALRNPDATHIRATSRAKTHTIALPALPSLDNFYVELRGLSEQVCGSLSDFYQERAKHLPPVQTHSLPYNTGSSIFADGTAEAAAAIIQQLERSSRPCIARDAFQGIAGTGDSFSCIDDFVHGLRQGLFFDRAMAPVIDFVDFHNHGKAHTILNACVTDFLSCGAQMVEGEYRRDWLYRFNGQTQSDSYHTLNHFRNLCKNLSIKKPELEGKISAIAETLRALQPLAPAAADAAATSILVVCDRVIALKRELDNQAWLDRMDEAKRKRIEDKAAAQAQLERVSKKGQ